MVRIRLATADDTENILAIYAPIVRDTAISFELKPPTPAQMQERIERTLAVLPWLVADAPEGVTGYAYASRHRERPAYQWAVDVSVYVRADARGRGVARALYSTMFGILEDLSYFTALAGIALPNAASVALHEAMGFAPIGVYRKVGYKLGAWHDVGWWQRALRPCVEDPTPPLTMREYRGTVSLPRRLSGSPPPK
jgi:phosphinothricin acetyltransferase